MRLIAVFLTCLFWMGLSVSTANSSDYQIKDLGTLGGSFTIPFRITATGQVVGKASTASGAVHAFYIPANGTIEDLGTLGGNFSQVNGIACDYLVGRSTLPTDARTHAFLYNLTTHKMTDIHSLLGATGFESSAISVNCNGIVVGAMVMNDGSTHAFAYDILTGSHTDLHPILAMGGSNDTAYAVNATGEIVGCGETVTGGAYRGFLYNPQTKIVTKLGLTGDNSCAADVDSANAVAGSATNSSHATRGFLWQSGKAIDLGDLGAGYADVQGMNDNGVVVGESSRLGTEAHAFVWENTTGIRDLNTLIPATSGWVLYRAYGVNDLGEIVGVGKVNGATHAFLLVPPA